MIVSTYFLAKLIVLHEQMVIMNKFAWRVYCK